MLPVAPYYGMYPAEDMVAPASIDDPMDDLPYRLTNGKWSIRSTVTPS